MSILSGVESTRVFFFSANLRGSTFDVIQFMEVDPLDKLNQFDITIMSKMNDIDPIEMIGQPATFNIHGEKGSYYYSGLIQKFKLIKAGSGIFTYQTRLVPRVMSHDFFYLNNF